MYTGIEVMWPGKCFIANIMAEEKLNNNKDYVSYLVFP